MDQKELDAIKAKIRAHLRSVTEASSKDIAKAIGEDWESVNSALNGMRTYGEVEMKNAGRGKGYVYWLVQVAEPALGLRTVEAGKGASLEQRAVGIAVDRHNETVELRQKLKTTEAALQAQSEVAANLTRAIEGFCGYMTEQFGRPVTILEAQELVGDLLLQKKAIMTLAKRLGCDSPQEVAGKVTQLEHDLENEKTASKLWKFNYETAEKKLTDASDVVDLKDADGFLVRAPKKVVVCNKLENAIASGKSAARAAKRKIPVFAIVRIGDAVPGAEWVERRAA